MSRPTSWSQWLKKNYEAATAAADDVLSDTGEPSAMNVVRLVKQFQQRNPALREAAVRRLLPYPGVARPVVLKAFREGSLAARLAAMELLEHWKAPLAGLDPWRPESFTPERLASLDKWTQREVGGDMAPPKHLSAEQLSAARRQIERMLHADEAEADAIRQRLAGWAPALLPEVYARLKDAATDQDRRRLLILRYRLAAPDSLVLVWPGGLERLGDSDPRQRRKAAEELAKLAGGEDKALLLGAVRRPRSPGARDQPPRPATHRRQGGRRRPGQIARRPGAQRPRRRAEAIGGDPRRRHGPRRGQVSQTGKGSRPDRPRHLLPAGDQAKRSPPVPHVAAEAPELAGAGGGGGRHRQVPRGHRYRRPGRQPPGLRLRGLVAVCWTTRMRLSWPRRSRAFPTPIWPRPSSRW